jgi:hypothetical protein
MRSSNWLLCLQTTLGIQSRREHSNALVHHLRRGVGSIPDPNPDHKQDTSEVCIGDERRIRIVTGRS